MNDKEKLEEIVKYMNRYEDLIRKAKKMAMEVDLTQPVFIKGFIDGKYTEFEVPANIICYIDDANISLIKTMQRNYEQIRNNMFLNGH